MLARRLGDVLLSDSTRSPSLTTYTSIHVSASTFHGTTSGTHNMLALISAIAAGAAAVIALILVLLLFHRRRELSRSDPCRGTPALRLLKRFSYPELKAATGRFCEASKLGQGGFGTVFKGTLEDGKEIAIKRLDTSSLQGENEFENEISVLGRLSSPYIAGLLGFCTEGQKKLLVYDLMENGSLQEALLGESKPRGLDWERRYKIMLDVACGLVFLHSDCDPPIIHGDIKPSNVLLDGHFTARIADFGLAKYKCEEDSTVFSGRLSLTREKIICDRSNAEARDGRKKLGSLKDEISVVRNQTEEEEALECGNGISFFSAELCQDDKKPNAESISQEMRRQAMVESADACKASPSVDEDETALYGWGKAGQSEELRSEISQISGTEQQMTGSKRKRFLEECGFVELILGCVGCHCSSIKYAEKDLIARVNSRKEHAGDGNHKAISRKKQKKPRVKAGSLEWWKECDGDTESKEFKKRLRQQQKLQIRKHRELRLAESREMRKTECSSDWWKEQSENLSCKSLSAESFTFDFSGELNHSMELAGQGRGFAKTASREWWSGDLSKGKEWWSGEFSSCKREKNAWSREFGEDPNQGKKLARHGSRSTDGWSGDLLSRGMGSTPSMRGTVCYVAPEYTGGGILSEKSDVYSYGVLMLVIISGRRPLQVISSPLHELERANLISWARHAAMAGSMLDLVDGSLQNHYCRDQACLCITLALLCLQKIPSSRPTMQDVVRYLTGEAEVPSLPSECFHSPSGGVSPLKYGRKSLVDQNLNQLHTAF